jgi:hypothetical protein
MVLPKRWIVERTLAWISRNRRLCRDYERHTRKAAAFVRLTDPHHAQALWRKPFNIDSDFSDGL